MSEHPGKAALKLLREYHAVFDFGHRGKADCADIASYVSDLEARLEKAEAERDELVQIANRAMDDRSEAIKAAFVEAERNARNDALEEAIRAAAATTSSWPEQRQTDLGDKIVSALRALKDKS